ncbi:MAG: czcD [Chlamydiales bacterium]|jgi:cation diffusion facilitator family transporter|nr:czcD [Chlamydiales bacterium]
MSQFPSAIPLSENILQARSQRSRQLIISSLTGVSIRLVIIVAELCGYIWFNSSALLLDAISSSADVVSSLFIILCIKLAERPPDTNHPFGHGRYEPLAGLQLGIFIALIGLGMFIQQSTELSTAQTKEIMHPMAWIIPCGAVILLELCYRIINKVAKNMNSAALAADAIHYRIDGINSLFATIALLLAHYFPHWGSIFDHIGAMAIAGLMVGLGSFAAYSNLQELLDRTPDQDFFERIKKAALGTQGVADIEKIRIQQYGPDAHVNIDVEVDPMMSVDEAHKISQQVRVAIQHEWPAVRDVVVHIEPYYPNDH